MKILSFYTRRGAVEEYRIFRPLERIKGSTIINTFNSGTLKTIAEDWKKKGDIWFVKYISDELINIILSARKLVDVKLVVDIDDCIWAIPRENVASAIYDYKRINAMNYLIENADWVTVSTKPLQELIKKTKRQVALLPNSIDPKEWRGKEREKEGKRGKKLRLCWIYSKTHRGDVVAIKEALESIWDKNKMELILLGGEPKVFNFKYQIIKGVKYKDYPKLLRRVNPDVSLAPLDNNLFNVCKSNIKWLESTMAGSAFIGSNIYPYKESVEHKKTGMLASNKKEWVEAIQYLSNETNRKRIIRNARKEVLENYDINKQINKYKDFFKVIL